MPKARKIVDKKAFKTKQMNQLFTFLEKEKMNKSHKNDKKDIILLSTAWSSPASNGCGAKWKLMESKGREQGLTFSTCPTAVPVEIIIV